jgi:hypothetical protein
MYLRADHNPWLSHPSHFILHPSNAVEKASLNTLRNNSFWGSKMDIGIRMSSANSTGFRQTGAYNRNGRDHSYSSQILIINFLGRRSHLGTNIHQPPRVSTPSTATLLAQLECFNCHYSRGEWRHTSQRASSNPHPPQLCFPTSTPNTHPSFPSE